MYNDLIRFIHISTQLEFATFQRKANAIIGPVNIPAPATLTGVVEALKSKFGLSTNQVAFAQKLAYASLLRHYKYNTTMMEDILSGNRRRRTYK
jgi:putative uncharacterized protein gbs0243